MPFGENVLVVRYEDVMLDMPEPYASKVIEDFMSKAQNKLHLTEEQTKQHANEENIPRGHLSSRARERDFLSTIRKNITLAMHLDQLDARMQGLFPCRTSGCEQRILEDLRT